MRKGWPSFALERLAMLKKWKKYAEIVAKACRELYGSKCLEVYVVGGVAEGRLTVLSDIDLVVIVGDSKMKTLNTVLAIKRRAEELGVPLDIPLDIKVMLKNEFEEKLGKLYRKAVRVL